MIRRDIRGTETETSFTLQIRSTKGIIFLFIKNVGKNARSHLTCNWFIDGIRGEGTTDEGISRYFDLKTETILPDMLNPGFKIKLDVDGGKGGVSEEEEG